MSCSPRGEGAGHHLRTTGADVDVHLTPDGSTAVVAPVGELDLATAPELRDALLRAALDRSLTVIDLAQVTFLDSVGMAVLAAAARRARAAGGGVRVVNASGRARTVLQLTGMSRVLGLDVPLPAQGGVPAVCPPPRAATPAESRPSA